MLIINNFYIIILHFFYIFQLTNQKKPKITYNNFTELHEINPGESIEYEIVKDLNFIEIDLYPISGKPVLFKYLCKTIDCTIKSSNYLQLHHQNLLQDSIRVGKQYITYIFPEEIPSQEIEDTLLVVSYCSGDKNCSFYFSGIKSFSPIILNKNIKLISGQMGIDNNYKINKINNENLELKFTFIYGSGNIKNDKYNIYLKGNSLVFNDTDLNDIGIDNDDKDEIRVFINSPSNLYFFEYYNIDNGSYYEMYNNLIVSEVISSNEIKRIKFIKEDFKINSNNNSSTLISFKSQNCELKINNLNDEYITNFYSIVTDESNLNFSISINNDNKYYENKFCFYQMYSMDLNEEKYILLSENVPMTLEFNEKFSSFTSQMAITYISKLPYKYILNIEPEEKTFYEVYISIQNKKFKYKVLYKKTIHLLDYIQKYCETSMICIINALIKNKNEKIKNPKITLMFKAFPDVPYFIPKNKLITDTFKTQLYVYTEIINNDYEFFSSISNNFGKSYGFVIEKEIFEKNKEYPIQMNEDSFNLSMHELKNSIVITNKTINCPNGCYVFFKLESFNSDSILKGNFYLRITNDTIKIKENEDIIGFIDNNNDEIIYTLKMIYNVSRFIFNIQSKGIKFLIQYNNSKHDFIIPNNNTENFQFYGDFYDKEINITIKLIDNNNISDCQYNFKIIPQYINDKDILPISEFRRISCDKIGENICYFYYHSINDEELVSFIASDDFNLTNKKISYEILEIGNNDINIEDIQNHITNTTKKNQTDSLRKPIIQISLSFKVIFLIEVNLIENVLINPIRLFMTKIIHNNNEFPINMNLNQEMIFGIEMINKEKIKIDFTHEINSEQINIYKYEINSIYGFAKFVLNNIQRIVNGNFVINPNDNEEFYISTINNQIFIFAIKLVIDENLQEIENINLNSQNTFIIYNYNFPMKFYIDVTNFISYNIDLKIKNPDIGTDYFINTSYFTYESYICEKNNNIYTNIRQLNFTIFELESYLILSSFNNERKNSNENYILITITKRDFFFDVLKNLSYIEFDILGYNTEKNYNYLSKGVYFYGAMNKKNQKTEYLLPDVKTFEFATCSNNIFNLTFKFKNNSNDYYYKDTKKEPYGKLLYEKNENDVFIEIENLNETNELVYYTLKCGIEKDVFYFPEGSNVNSTYSNNKFEIKYSNVEKKNVNFNFNERYLLRINTSSLLSNHSICYQKKYSIEEINNIKSYNINLITDNLIGYSVVAFFYDDNIEEMFIAYDVNDLKYEKPNFIIVIILIVVIIGLIIFIIIIYLFSKVKQMEQNFEELEDIDARNRNSENSNYSFESNSSFDSSENEK